MPFYTFDRRGCLSEGKVVHLFDDYSLSGIPDASRMVDRIKLLYPEGISEFGNTYIFTQYGANLQKDIESTIGKDLNLTIDAIFELVRQLYYPDKISRFQSLFAVEQTDVEKLKHLITLPDECPLYEIESATYEKHDMKFLRGFNYITFLHNAHLYWSGSSSDEPLYEYLLKPPVTVIRRIK